jgi:multiple sugar transport system substrate-binding protein
VKALSYSKASTETLAVARPKPTIPESPQLTEILVRELSLALTGKKTSKAALDTAAAEMGKLLGACAPLKYPVN